MMPDCSFHFSRLLLLILIVVGVSCRSEPKPETDPQSIRQRAWNAIERQDFASAAASLALVATLANESGNDYYNAACCFSLAGDVESGLDMLGRALDSGYTNRSNLLYDSDLDNLRNDPRFAVLLDRTEDLQIVITDNVKHNAAEAEFVFEDAHNFLRAMEMVRTGADIVPTLEEEYFAKATAGLRQMVVKYPFTAEELAQAIERHPEKYQHIERNVRLLEARVPEFREAYRRYQEWAPDVVFPPTFFLVDKNRGIGSGSPDGQLISIERRTDESIGHLENLLLHELTHFQQLRAAGSDEFYAVFGAKKDLLSLTIREGTAQFIAAKITGRNSKAEARGYVLANETEVWQRFQDQMMSRETGDWMWSQPSDEDQPRDIAYELGALIVEAYYENAPDKQRAIQEIFAVTDCVRFLDESGYGSRLLVD